MPTSIKAAGIIDLAYSFNDNGNLEYRTDAINPNFVQQEQFLYDGMNRLTNWDIYQNGTLKKQNGIIYNQTTSNIEQKTDLGNFTLNYGEGNGKPHALTSISGAPANFPTADLLVTYTDFKKIKTLDEGNKHYELTYGVDDQRRMSVQTQGLASLTRYYVGDYEEEIDALGNVRKIHYLSGAILIQNQGKPDSLLYTYSDYQGSLIALANASGTVIERYAYDPWGARRNPTDWTQTDTRTKWITNRGYTGHEHLDQFGIINMNGRVYDPLTASFFSPDPYVQAPGDWLNYNRYTYCYGNPFKYTDPTGEFLTWSFSKGGFSIGFNLTPIGIPLGAGINIGWSNGFSMGGYGEVGYRVGGSGLGAGVAAQQNLDYNVKHNTWSTTTTELAYASLGPLTVGGNLSQTYNITNDQWSYGWGVNAGIGIGNDKGSIGLNIGYGSGGWSYGIGGSSYTSYEKTCIRTEARNKQNIYNAVDRNLNGSGVDIYGAFHGVPSVNYLSISGEFVGFYGNAPVYELSWFNDGSAVTTPPDGIWVGNGVYNSRTSYNMSLMAHEYGHWIQYEQSGFSYYYGVIAPASFYYASKGNSYGWTELGASNNGYRYSNQPSWWDFKHFPLKKK